MYEPVCGLKLGQLVAPPAGSLLVGGDAEVWRQLTNQRAECKVGYEPPV